MAFKGNVRLTIEKLLNHDEFGQPVVSATYSSKCEVVKLTAGSQKTLARMSQSASLGNASEIITDARLLVSLKTPIEIGDRLLIAGASLKVDSRLLRFDVNGRQDHLQIDCSIWV